MEDLRKIKTALLSVYYKDNLEPVVKKLHSLGVKLISTGGTFEYIQKLGIEAIQVENLTNYPAILGGRVKTLHPKIFGGILARRDEKNDEETLKTYEIPEIDLVIVDLYPFEETLKKTSDEIEIIEKIDIGGISLIRAAAKNYRDVLVVSSSEQYSDLLQLLSDNQGYTGIKERKKFAAMAFNISSHYDTAIFDYFNSDDECNVFKKSIIHSKALRYGENPHQQGIFYGNLNEIFEQLHGKEISYNNLIDIDSGINLINDFDETTFAIIKHTNACGLASRNKLIDAWKDALAGDPVSAYGGVLITNASIDLDTAQEINKLFFEIILAPGYQKNVLELLQSKKNRIILQSKSNQLPKRLFRSVLNGVIEQTRDDIVETSNNMKTVTILSPSEAEIKDLVFANKVVKHLKSNTIVIAKNKQLIASGVGQTSRVDALKQAVAKAGEFGFDLHGAVMASDAYFPFADSAEIADKAGIKSIIQPGGSIRDADTINYCNSHGLSMVFTGVRHFKH